MKVASLFEKCWEKFCQEYTQKGVYKFAEKPPWNWSPYYWDEADIQHRIGQLCEDKLRNWVHYEVAPYSLRRTSATQTTPQTASSWCFNKITNEECKHGRIRLDLVLSNPKKQSSIDAPFDLIAEIKFFFRPPRKIRKELPKRTGTVDRYEGYVGKALKDLSLLKRNNRTRHAYICIIDEGWFTNDRIKNLKRKAQNVGVKILHKSFG